MGKGWIKNDQLLKHVGSLSNISQEELNQIRDDCNSFFWEAKYKRKLVIQISFLLIDMNNENLKNHYTLGIIHKDKKYDKKLIMELAKIVKEGIKAKDKIKIYKSPKLFVNNEAVTMVDFSKF